MFGFFNISGFNPAPMWTALAVVRMYDELRKNLLVKAFLLEHCNC